MDKKYTYFKGINGLDGAGSGGDSGSGGTLEGVL
jgi:hypothetical protein